MWLLYLRLIFGRKGYSSFGEGREQRHVCLPQLALPLPAHYGTYDEKELTYNEDSRIVYAFDT
eukprot:1158702-Pelagomonas_calceolata.AAC.10